MTSLFGVEHILESDGCPIHFWDGGASNGPAILFSHGGQVDHTMFESQVTLLASTHRVITWDARGHGLSQPLKGQLTYRQMAEDMVAILDQLSIRQTALAGHSMGGCAAQELAYHYPERVMALALIGAPRITVSAHPATQFTSRLLLTVSRLFPENRLKAFMDGAANTYSRNPAVQAYIRASTAKLAKETFVAINRLVLEGFYNKPDYQFGKPMLLAYGEHDIPQIASLGPQWAAAEPNCRHVIIPEAGHNANQDNPDAFNSLLADFLAEVWPQPEHNTAKKH